MTITSEDYGSFTTEDYEWVGREADEAIALKTLEDLERVQIEADEATAKKASEDTAQHQSHMIDNKDKLKKIALARVGN
ncbi:hypothetical protein E2562_019332 [Oryza meyeriana var. granulata]|uniref:Uncharacterized protein n=1 Tax=Oryza meyeriana var. granulata TaxID=110450 RepID=A0A6G1C930_9ORYZ|nr:hypothetical protein E2562_019332 [Oryza meyeriana var. granulata]